MAIAKKTSASLTETASLETQSEVSVKISDLKQRHTSLPTWLIFFSAGFSYCAYYSLSTPLQNYIQNAYDDPLRPGALGLGQQTATVVSLCFSWACTLASIAGALVADMWLGRYKTIVYGLLLSVVGALVLLVGSIPAILDRGNGIVPLGCGLVLFSIGFGGWSANFAALVGDQCCKPQAVKDSSDALVSGSGQEAKVLESAFKWFYWMINIGSFGALAVTLLEKYVDFWAAFIIPVGTLALALVFMLLTRPVILVKEPAGSALPASVRQLWASFISRHFKSSATGAEKPHVGDNAQAEYSLFSKACRIFLAWPILGLCRSQLTSNLISQTGQMQAGKLPNDLFVFLNPVFVMILLPLCEKCVGPALERRKIRLSVLTRMIIGFGFEAAAMAYAAILQSLIYRAPPCFSHPLQCTASEGGRLPNRLSAWLQTPFHFLEALSEIYGSTAGYEFAEQSAPLSMKSTMQAVQLFMGACGSLIGLAVSPAYRDPNMVIVYSSFAASMTVATAYIWGVSWKR